MNVDSARQETVDVIYETLVSRGDWPLTLDIQQQLLQFNAVDLRRAMLDAAWLFQATDMRDAPGSVRLTYAGLCLASREEAREDATYVLRYVRAVGRLAMSSKNRTPIIGIQVVEEIGDAPSKHRFLLCEETMSGLGFSVHQSNNEGQWSITWDNRLVPLSSVETADALMQHMFGLGVAEHQVRHYPATKAPVPAVSARDRKLFRSLLRALPYRGSISFIQHANMAGFSFDCSKLQQMELFVTEWRDAEHRFQHPLLERARRILHLLCSRYFRYIGIWTFPTHDGLQTVPPEWEDEQPSRFRYVVDELHRMGGEIVHYHQELVSLAAVLIP